MATIEPTTETRFGIARGGELIDTNLYASADVAKQQLAWTESTMQSVGLTPDVEIVTVDLKTTASKPKRWIDPDALVDDEAGAGEPAPQTADEGTPKGTSAAKS